MPSARSSRSALLPKSRRRDVNAWDHGTFTLLDAGSTGVILRAVSLDEVEDWLVKLTTE